MNSFARLRNVLPVIFLFTTSLCALAQQYKLSGSYPDSRIVQSGDVFLLNDSCTFFVQNQSGDTVKFKSCEWIYAGQFTNLEYNPLNTKSNLNTFGFKLDESIKEYSSSTQLNRITVESENSIYFSAKIKVNGITETNDNVSLEFPIFLNVLPGIPHLTFVELLDIGEYDPQYDDYINATMLAQLNIDRTIKYKVICKDEGMYVPFVYYLNIVDNQTDYEFTLNGYNSEFIFTAFNQFGVVINDKVFNFEDEALEALRQILSVDNELSDNSRFIVYINPVENNLYVTGKTESIRQLQIINSQGQLLKTIHNIIPPIDFTSYPKGLYIIRLVTDTQNQQTYKILNE